MCCGALVKYFLFFANLLFFLAGGALLAVGILYKVGYDDITNAIPDDFNIEYAPTAAIVVGAIVFVIAFFGCCGAIRENRCMLITYGLILFLLLAAQIAIGAYALVEINRADGDYDFKAAVNKAVENLFRRYGNNTNSRESVDYIQQEFECCGLEKHSDWDIWGIGIPDSCCGDPPCTAATSYSKGCAQVLYDFFNRSIKIVGGVVIGVVAVEIIGMIFSCGLASAVKKKGRSYY